MVILKQCCSGIINSQKKSLTGQHCDAAAIFAATPPTISCSLTTDNYKTAPSFKRIPVSILRSCFYSAEFRPNRFPEAEAMQPEGTAVKSSLEKPLHQLTEDDIAQVTREDCRRYLKEKGRAK